MRTELKIAYDNAFKAMVEIEDLHHLKCEQHNQEATEDSLPSESAEFLGKLGNKLADVCSDIRFYGEHKWNS